MWAEWLVTGGGTSSLEGCSSILRVPSTAYLQQAWDHPTSAAFNEEQSECIWSWQSWRDICPLCPPTIPPTSPSGLTDSPTAFGLSSLERREKFLAPRFETLASLKSVRMRLCRSTVDGSKWSQPRRSGQLDISQTLWDHESHQHARHIPNSQV